MPLDLRQSLKEVVRHVLFRVGAHQLIDRLRRRRGRYVEHMDMSQLPQVFSSIYENRVWIEERGQLSLSGAGSTADATRSIGVALSRFLKETGCKRLVDIGCGDFSWMRDVEGDFEYLGIDVVPSLVENNNRIYGSTRRRFVCLDVTSQPIERWGDVAICREVLFHLSLKNAQGLLRHIKKADFRHVLLTNDSSIWFNSDIRDGDFRRINLTKYPFRLPAPITEFRDDMVSDGRVLGLWSGSAL